MDTEELWEIPNYWEWTQIKTLGDVVAGGTPSTQEPTYWGDDVNWLSPADLTGYSSKTIAHGAKGLSIRGLQNSSAKVMPAGSVHFSSRAPIGYVAISSEPVATNQGFKSLVPAEGVFNEYVYFYLKGSKQLAEKRASGTTFLELSGKAFGLLPFPLPPSNEQVRIVAKIEELFSELDKGVENLKTAREQLKVYRQSVLKHAFEGKLTAQWRDENKEKLETADELLVRIMAEREVRYQQQLDEWNEAVKKWELNGKPGKRPKKPRAVKPLAEFTNDQSKELPAPPEGWSWVKIDKICDHQQNAIKAGPFGSALKKEFYTSKGYKIFGQEQVISGDPFYGDYFISEEKYRELEACKIKPFDILISLVGTVGKVLVLPNGIDEGIINPRLIKISPNLDVYDPRFFKFFFESAFVRGLYKTETHGATMDVMNLSILQSLPFPLCSLQEQSRIINEIEAIDSEIVNLELQTEQQTQSAEALRQAILKSAFAGQLVDQDTNDEPASVLLERIKDKKVEQQKINKNSKKRKNAA